MWVPDDGHEALRDLVRAREAAKQDQMRARHRLSKFLLRHGRRPPAGIKPWTLKYMDWIRGQVEFEQPAQEYTRLDYLQEVEHSDDRVRRLEAAIGEGSSRQCCESSKVQVLAPSIACIWTARISGACGGNAARSART